MKEDGSTRIIIAIGMAVAFVTIVENAAVIVVFRLLLIEAVAIKVKDVAAVEKLEKELEVFPI